MFALALNMVVSLPLVLLGLVIMLRARQVVTIGHNVHDRVAALHRYTSRWRLAGLAVGLVGFAICLSLSDVALGRITALAPAALVAGILGGTIWGELTARSPQGFMRQATISPRRAGALAPRRWVVLTSVSVGALLLVLAVGWALGGADDMGRPGRALVRSCTTVLDDGTVIDETSRSGPWPGSFYVVPVLAAFVLLALLTVLALRAIALRRSAGPDSKGLDTLIRGWAARNVLLAASVGSLLNAGLFSSLMASQLQSTGQCAAGAHVAVFWVLAAVAVFATPIALTLLGALFVGPRIVVEDLPRAQPGPADPAEVPVR